MSDKPWGVIDPNSQHQLWSHWTFRVFEGGRPVPANEVIENVRRWLRLGFGSVGEARITPTVFTEKETNGARPLRMTGYVIDMRVEGPPAHDPDYVAAVRRAFADFVQKGWGPYATSDVVVRVLAGDQQDGKPPAQVIVGAMILSRQRMLPRE